VTLPPASAADGISRVLVVNAGSNSLKLSVLGWADEVTAALTVDPWDGGPDHAELRGFLRGQSDLDAVGHRVVHGGSRFTAATVIDEPVIAAIADLTDLAPLHQPRALAGIRAARVALPGLPQVACFDTAFHAGLPPAAARYALPAQWTDRFGLRRYGLHGLSHQYASKRCAQLLGADARRRVVTCHLGAGSSLAAVRDGASVDTTMGFTPLEGLVMATRCGNLDPGLLMWLLQHGGLSPDEVSLGIEHTAGLAGLAALPDGSGDMREVRAAADAGSPAARLAIDVHTHRLRQEIASMTAAMDGLDALVFAGGIGEHQPPVRAEAAAGLGFLGVAIDPARNDGATGDDVEISAASARVRTLVITAREDIEVARQVRTALGLAAHRAGPTTLATPQGQPSSAPSNAADTDPAELVKADVALATARAEEITSLSATDMRAPLSRSVTQVRSAGKGRDDVREAAGGRRSLKGIWTRIARCPGPGVGVAR
jgi:acetate kinase